MVTPRHLSQVLPSGESGFADHLDPHHGGGRGLVASCEECRVRGGSSSLLMLYVARAGRHVPEMSEEVLDGTVELAAVAGVGCIVACCCIDECCCCIDDCCCCIIICR